MVSKVNNFSREALDEPNLKVEFSSKSLSQFNKTLYLSMEEISDIQVEFTEIPIGKKYDLSLDFSLGEMEGDEFIVNQYYYAYTDIYLTKESDTINLDLESSMKKITTTKYFNVGDLIFYGNCPVESEDDGIGYVIKNKYLQKYGELPYNTLGIIFKEGTPENALMIAIDSINSDEKKAWATTSAYGYNRCINDIVCSPIDYRTETIVVEGEDYDIFLYDDGVTTFTGATEGKNNLSAIQTFDTSFNISNYPLFKYANEYGESGSLSGYSNSWKINWFVPSIYELSLIYKNKNTINHVLESIYEPQIEEKNEDDDIVYYWTSSQYRGLDDYDNCAFQMTMLDGEMIFYEKHTTERFFVVRNLAISK